MQEGEGNKVGFLALMSMLNYCYELGIKYVTFYAFSIGNFNHRPSKVQYVMDLMQEKIEGLLKEENIVNSYEIRIYFLGNLKLLNEPVRLAVEKAMAATTKNDKAVLMIYGSAGPQGSGIGIVLVMPSDHRIEKTIKLNFYSTNNETEYEEILHGLDLTLTLGAEELTVYVDSLLMSNHYNKTFKTMRKMVDYAALVEEKMQRFKHATISYLPRQENRHADALAYIVALLGDSEKRSL
ncbi:hypothetical protein GIB67_042182 [Kingdonia uniflora]|uniref:RNase H type-1 domain-containing protein n=1 Tax=Kingdonia uniflora TaxID=39325 RepID=A0A7J7NWT6_9MAGN|nr:hypothetical protein GIB67_042182 [Kingdonia uniflora]